MLPCVVLQSACEEGLWKEKPRNPEALRGPILYPVSQEIYSVIQILGPGG